MQTWQLFIVLRQHVTISATVFSNPTKLINDLYMKTYIKECCVTILTVVTIQNIGETGDIYSFKTRF